MNSKWHSDPIFRIWKSIMLFNFFFLLCSTERVSFSLPPFLPSFLPSFTCIFYWLFVYLFASVFFSSFLFLSYLQISASIIPSVSSSSSALLRADDVATTAASSAAAISTASDSLALFNWNKVTIKNEWKKEMDISLTVV